MDLDRLLFPGTPPDVRDVYASLAESARDAVWGFEDELAFVDVETTGFDARGDALIEVAALIARGPEVLDRFSTLVDPGRPVPAFATALTGIADEDVAGAPAPSEAASMLASFVGERGLVAHHAEFDRAFLRAALGRPLPGVWLDSLQLARIALPRLRTHRLSDLAAVFGLAEATHRAAADAEALFGVWRVLLCGLDALPPEVVAAIASLASRVAPDWPLLPLLSRETVRRGSPPLEMRTLRRRAAGRLRSNAMRDAHEEEVEPLDMEEVRAAFEPDGLLQHACGAFERRPEQVRMSEEVLGAFATAKVLAVEAGTGVGKSLAYLVPAVLFAQRNRVAVGVATRTNALTDQLVHGELPALSAALGRPLRFVSLKGYEHYLCLRKWGRMLGERDGETGLETLAVLAALLSWVAQTPWGDLDEVNVHWPPGLRQSLCCGAEDCGKKRCRYYPDLCYLHGLRRRASSAHVVVTNHALMFRDLVAGGAILPPVRYWVVDEAHGAEAEARKQLSLEVRHATLLPLLRALHSPGRGGLLDSLRATVAAAAGEAGAEAHRALDAATAETETAAVIAASFFDLLKDVAEGAGDRAYDRCELRLDARVRDSAAWSPASGAGRSLARRLGSLLDEGRRLVTLLEELGEPAAERRADLAGRLAVLGEQLAALSEVLEGESDRFVYSLTADRRREVMGETLTAAVVDVGVELAGALYPVVDGLVYTSATLACGEDDFSHFARSVGLDLLPEGSWTSLALASSYDLERQMSVFVPLGLPEPGCPGHAERLAAFLGRLHRAMGGAVLTLFTNRREMEAVHALAAPSLEAEGLRVLLQDRGTSRKRLRDEFLADETVSLFATKSFWEGFDARGDALRCVVIARLPFGQPNEPLNEERRERDPAGWWDACYLPQAVIELKQAAGRLIRSSEDTGCVVIADTRIAGGKPYARRFLDALPVRDVEMLPIEEVVGGVALRFGREAPARGA